MSPVLRVAWYRFRATFGYRWGGYLSVVLLVGLIGGLAMGAVAGARRTESSFPVYLASTNPSTIGVFSRYDDPGLGLTTGYDPRLAEAIAHLPLVERAATAIIFDGNINLDAVTGVHPHIGAGEAPPSIVGSADGEYSSMDRVSLVEGRLPNRASTNEAVMNAQAAEELGAHIGSIIGVPFYTDAQNASANPGEPFLTARVKIVGEVVKDDTLVESDYDALGSALVILSPGLTRLMELKCATGTETYLQITGGDRNAKRVLAEFYRLDPVADHFPAQLTSSFVPTIQQAIAPEAIALGVFGGIAGLAVLLIVGLLIGRIVRAEADEADRLRALGANGATMLVDGAMGVLGALLVGSVLGVAVAVGLSPLTPLGPVRPVYPDPGVGFDWTVLGLGLLGLVTVLGSLTVVLAGRQVKRIRSHRPLETWRREPRWVRSALVSGLPISAVTGLRQALEPGKGRSATPVRSAMLGTAIAVTALVATITFGSSLDNLVSRPALYGWNWSYVMFAGFAGKEDLPGPQLTRLLNDDGDVAAWSGVNFASALLDGQHVGTMTENPGSPVAPPLLSGHGLEASNEIVLGDATMAQLHKRLGDTVTFDDKAGRPRKLLIVGTATMPSITSGSAMGSGALVATSDFPTSLLNVQENSIPGPNAVLVRVRADVRAWLAYRSLEQIDTEINALPNDEGSAGGVVSVLRPAAIVNFRAMGTTPALLAAGLAIGAVVALGLTLAASVRRRRRDLALLKTLGFTQLQLAASVACQATVTSVIGIVVGLPIGVAIGRQLWTLFAHQLNAVPDPTVPVVSVCLVGLGALVFANVVAALPGRSAAHTPTGLVLRAE
ncbi:MAG: FtsX-like permease family protein [Acidimicrobiales bacterium]|jgi:hypothetical protein